MGLIELSINNRLSIVISTALILFAGWYAFQNMPRFEDPEFIIRSAKIFTQYPGGSPVEVAREVSEPLETALQQLHEIKTIRAKSSAGISEITLEVKFEFTKTRAELESFWAKLRNKLRDAEHTLPQEALTPVVKDDFGEIYGLSYFISGDDYSPTELRAYARQLQKELLQVKNVARVQLLGEQDEAIFVEIPAEKRAVLGVTLQKLYDILAQQNSVVEAGSVVIGDQRLVIDPSGAIDSVDAIKNLLVSTAGDGKIIYLKDIANIYRDYKTPAHKIIRYQGKQAIALGVAAEVGENIVVIGEAVNQKLASSLSRRPLGMDVSEYYHQGKVVEASVQRFFLNVAAALTIVLLSLLVFMGRYPALIMSIVLLLTVAATFATMQLLGIPIHRVSLGALILALGMMVDNAVVVVEAIFTGLIEGIDEEKSKLSIVRDVVVEARWPLLAATLVGVIAFAPIGFAPGQTAEYAGDLFWVVTISLLFSWLFAVTITPLACYYLFPNGVILGKKQRKSVILSTYKQLVCWVLARRWKVVAFVSLLFFLSVFSLQFISKGFFPQSTTPQMVVDYWLPEGTRIERTQQDMLEIEAFVLGLEGVNAVQTIIGGGGVRYMLTYTPQSSNSAYGQLLVRVDDYRTIDRMLDEVREFIEEQFPEGQANTSRFVIGPGGRAKVEAKFSGPDPRVLRRLANEAKAIILADGGALSIKDDWGPPVSVVEPVYSEIRGRRAGVSRKDLAEALANYYSGRWVGEYREGADLIAIISRMPESKTASINDIKNIQVLSAVSGKMVPIAQVTDGFRTIWRDGNIRSEDRMFTMKVQAEPYSGQLASMLLQRISKKIEKIDLPNGYQFAWGGEADISRQANRELMSTIPLALLAMVLVVVFLFGKLRQPLIVWLVVPLGVSGVVFGLLVTGVALEYIGMIGFISLSGLLIQNAIILVDRIDIEIARGKPRLDAIVDSAVSRFRPVVLGSLTTALSVIPLFFDVFFQSMAVVIFFGLSFGTVLTLFVVPALYTVFMKVSLKEVGNARH
ncbi:MAG: efflux RND transporter permease subunit [Gammaproteobacteria bacterium]|nr:efflux RND transporter permease subunit [Gammaproteobacteria bacterium]MBQ0839197.1 efflux RND transporter permease subunit [Gammaproteobacteria bacterium]